MYDKSKSELLKYIKKQDDEIKVLNSRIDLLSEATRMNTEDIKNLRENYTYVYWENDTRETAIKNIKLDYSRMERKVKTASVMVYIQPFIWSAVWFFMNWLLKG